MGRETARGDLHSCAFGPMAGDEIQPVPLQTHVRLWSSTAIILLSGSFSAMTDRTVTAMSSRAATRDGRSAHHLLPTGGHQVRFGPWPDMIPHAMNSVVTSMAL